MSSEAFYLNPEDAPDHCPTLTVLEQVAHGWSRECDEILRQSNEFQQWLFVHEPSLAPEYVFAPYIPFCLSSV